MHDSSIGIGNVMTATRVGNTVEATGTFDDTTPEGANAARMMDEGSAPMGNRWGLSIEPEDVTFEVVDTKSQIIDGTPQEPDAIVASAVQYRGSMARAIWRRMRSLRAASGEPEPEGTVVYEDSSDSVLMRYTGLKIAAVAMEPVGALDGAYMELDPVGASADEGNQEVPAVGPAIAAAGATLLKPARARFFEPEPEEGDDRLVPQYDEHGGYIGDAVPLYIEDDGSVFGHVAPANRCHIGYADVCVTPPTSLSAYRKFHVGYTVVDDGERLPTGALCAGCDHAAVLGLDERAARDWYANMGLGWANVRIVPGRYGPWMCGSLRPNVTDELVFALRGGGVSGDWRGDERGLELIGVLAVSVPGFTIERALVSSAGGTFLPVAQSAMSMVGREMRIITAPVQRTASVVAAAGHKDCSCGAGPSEELRLARENNYMLRKVFEIGAGSQLKAQARARLHV
jgi:hypothetical protein